MAAVKCSASNYRRSCGGVDPRNCRSFNLKVVKSDAIKPKICTEGISIN